MQQQYNSNWLRDAVLTTAGVVIILTWMRYAQGLIVPFLLSLFISIIAAAPLEWLKKRGWSVPLAVGLVLLVITVQGVLLSALIGTTMQQFSESLPTFQASLRELTSVVLKWFTEHGLDISTSGIADALDPAAVMGFANNLVARLGLVLSNVMLIMFTVMFILLEASTIPEKFKAIHSERSELVQARIADIIQSTKQYISIKALMSLATGLLIWAGTALAGIEFAVLWGFLAFLLNFIPNVGSIIAAIPTVLLALVQLGPMSALLVIIIYLAVNTVIGNYLEPRLMGKKVGLSTLVVFLSLVFWGWLLGPVGMLLSVPLTMVVKFAAMSSDDTRWFAIMLGSEVETKDQTLPQNTEKEI